MFRSVISGLTLVALFSLGSQAQDFRVFTAVYDLSAAPSGGKPPVVARDLTLFHAGKVYDHLEGAEEIIIFEPTERRFRVLNPARGLAATVEFDEIKQMLKRFREETDRRAAQLATKNDPGAAKTAALLRFQLAPRFQETFDEASGQLTLDGGFVRYDVKSAAPQQPEIAAAYLEYADWLHRLNFLLRPNPLLPDVRIALDQSLRTRGRLPETVEQKVELTPPLHGRAEHSLKFGLNAQDREMIRQWESLLASDKLRQVPLREYQRMLVAARAN